MTAPTSVGPNQVWLGRFTDPAEIGYLDVVGVMQPSELATIPRKVTIGNTTPDSDPYISSLILDDLSGGVGIEEANISIHRDRFRIGFAATRFPRQIALGHYVYETKPDWAEGEAFGLGDVYSETTGRVSTFYAAWGTDVAGFNEEIDDWYEKATDDLDYAPVRRGTPFKGMGDHTRLFVPCGADGYATITETAAGVPSIANVAQDDTPGLVGSGPETNDGVPGPVDFCHWDNKLYALDTRGQLWWSLTGNADDWHFVRDEVDLPLKLDGSRIPRCLVVGVNKAGDRTLYVISDMDVWAYDAHAGVLYLTNMHEMDHPDFGLDATMWRAGEDLWITYGMGVLRMTSNGVPVPDSGLDRDDGLPADLRGRIVSLARTNESLWCLVEGDVVAQDEEVTTQVGSGDDLPTFPHGTAFSSIFEWNGSGWSGVWKSDVSGATPNWLINSRIPGGRRVWWGSTDGYMRSFRIRAPFHTPHEGFIAGQDEFAVTSDIETFRFDAGMTAFDKILEGVVVDMRHATNSERVEIYYRTNYDHAQGIKTYPHLLGVADKLDLNYFALDPNKDGFAEGVCFNWIQFLLRLRRRTSGDDAIYQTPIIRSFVAHYIQRPQNVTAFTWRIVLPREAYITNGPAQMRSRLDELIQSRELLCLVHGNRRYRGYLSGIHGQEKLGPEPEGLRTLSFLEIPDKELLHLEAA